MFGAFQAGIKRPNFCHSTAYTPVNGAAQAVRAPQGAETGLSDLVAIGGGAQARWQAKQVVRGCRHRGKWGGRSSRRNMEQPGRPARPAPGIDVEETEPGRALPCSGHHGSPCPGAQRLNGWMGRGCMGRAGGPRPTGRRCGLCAGSELGLRKEILTRAAAWTPGKTLCSATRARPRDTV